MKTRSVISFFLLIILFSLSCSKRPDYVLPKDKMVDVLYDLQMANSINETSTLPAEKRTDEYKKRIIAGVLHKHNITQLELDSSIAWYSDNIEDYKKINDSLITRYNSELTRLREEEMTLDRRRYGSSDLLENRVYLTNNSPLYSFKMTSARLNKIGKEYLGFKFDVLGLDSLEKIETSIYFAYQDTTVSYSLLINDDTHCAFSKPDLPDSLLNSVAGYVRLNSAQSKYRYEQIPVLIYNIQYQDSTKVDDLELEYF